MAVQRPQFEVVHDETEPRQAPPQQNSASIAMLTLALRALSERAVIALADLFTLLTVGSAFWLWWTIPDPNPQQIVSLSIYAAFILAANWLIRRK